MDGVSGSIRLIVDGDKPEIEDIVPASGGTQSSSTVNLGFTVSDDGSGIRYDGESGASGDPDLTPQNGDGDQRFDEPITNLGADSHPGCDVIDVRRRQHHGHHGQLRWPDDFSTMRPRPTSPQYGSNGWTQRA